MKTQKQISGKVMVAVAVALFTATWIQSLQAVVLSPTAYWQFNAPPETQSSTPAYDTSGNGYDLTKTFTSPGLFYDPGLFGTSLRYDGNGAHYAGRTVDDAVFNVGSGDFTAQVWYKPDAIGGEQVLMEDFTGASGPGWTFYKNSANGLEFYGAGAGVFVASTLNGFVTTGAWQQFVVTRSGNLFTLYFDGLAVGSGTQAGAISSSTNPLIIGAREIGGNHNKAMSGDVDEVAFWNSALSGSQIAFLYNSGLGVDLTLVPEPSTMALLGLGGLLVLRRQRKK